MAQLVIAAAGAAIGGYLVPGAIALGVTGAQAGWIVGSLIGSSFAPAQKVQGPRLSDLSVGSSAYGTPIPFVQGSPRLAGQIVWASSKREIATTTRQGGKGGGGKQKVTTYSYEIDLLVLLSDNVIPGISRVWSNGKLIWNKAYSADTATKLASDSTAAWTRITAYKGSASQLPDPTYEAAVGTANAPAYRGRGSVFIQGLQLGSSGQIPNLTFEIGEPWDGDHVAGDGLTRLQVAFAGASSADVSSFAIGSGTNDEVTVVTGSAYTIFDSNANPKSLLYSDAGLAQLTTTSPVTYEIFWKATLDTPSPQNPGNLVKFAQFTIRGTGIDFSIKPIPNDGDIIIVHPSLGTVTVAGGNVYGALNHLAMVARTTGLIDIYANGVRVVTGFNDPGSVVSPGALQLGGIGRGDTKITYYGARVRRAEMYSGASFAMPGGPAVWGLP